MCSWVIRPAALAFHFSSSGKIHILSGLCSFLFSLCTNLLDVSTDSFDVSDMIQLIKSHLNVSLSQLCFLFYTHQVPVSLLPPWSPCVRVPHLSFGCCADGSLLVLHNGSKVSVPHTINTLKLHHSSCLQSVFVVYLKWFSLKRQHCSCVHGYIVVLN